ncbi:MAG: AAA family ATPase, partial [Acidimicrobiales bacterium]
MDWPLVGRAAELEKLLAALRADDRAAAVVTGPAGVGKTRLALECLAQAAADGATTAGVAGSAGASQIPFGLFDTLIAAQDSSPPAVLAALSGLAGSGAPLVLLVDNASLVDPASAAVLHQLVMSGGAFVVFTMRSGEQPPDALTGLRKEDAVVAIELAGLDRRAVDELLPRALGHPVAGATSQAVWDASHGNPLYVRELVRGALADGQLQLDAGVWRLTRPLTTTPVLEQLVLARLADLAPEAERAVELLAIGEPLPLAWLVADAGLEALDAIEQREVARLGDGDAVRLADPVYGDVVRASLSASRRQELSRRLADLAEA